MDRFKLESFLFIPTPEVAFPNDYFWAGTITGSGKQVDETVYILFCGCDKKDDIVSVLKTYCKQLENAVDVPEDKKPMIAQQIKMTNHYLEMIGNPQCVHDAPRDLLERVVKDNRDDLPKTLSPSDVIYVSNVIGVCPSCGR